MAYHGVFYCAENGRMEDAPKKAGIKATDLLGKRWEDRPSFLAEPRMKWVALQARPTAGGGGWGRWGGA